LKNISIQAELVLSVVIVREPIERTKPSFVVLNVDIRNMLISMPQKILEPKGYIN